jgi:hypothetical protein
MAVGKYLNAVLHVDIQNKRFVPHAPAPKEPADAERKASKEREQQARTKAAPGALAEHSSGDEGGGEPRSKRARHAATPALTAQALTAHLTTLGIGFEPPVQAGACGTDVQAGEPYSIDLRRMWRVPSATQCIHAVRPETISAGVAGAEQKVAVSLQVLPHPESAGDSVLVRFSIVAARPAGHAGSEAAEPTGITASPSEQLSLHQQQRSKEPVQEAVPVLIHDGRAERGHAEVLPLEDVSADQLLALARQSGAAEAFDGCLLNRALSEVCSSERSAHLCSLHKLACTTEGSHVYVAGTAYSEPAHCAQTVMTRMQAHLSRCQGSRSPSCR